MQKQPEVASEDSHKRDRQPPNKKKEHSAPLNISTNNLMQVCSKNGVIILLYKQRVDVINSSNLVKYFSLEFKENLICMCINEDYNVMIVTEENIILQINLQELENGFPEILAICMKDSLLEGKIVYVKTKIANNIIGTEFQYKQTIIGATILQKRNEVFVLFRTVKGWYLYFENNEYTYYTLLHHHPRTAICTSDFIIFSQLNELWCYQVNNESISVVFNEKEFLACKVEKVLFYDEKELLIGFKSGTIIVYDLVSKEIKEKFDASISENSTESVFDESKIVFCEKGCDDIIMISDSLVCALFQEELFVYDCTEEAILDISNTKLYSSGDLYELVIIDDVLCAYGSKGVEQLILKNNIEVEKHLKISTININQLNLEPPNIIQVLKPEPDNEILLEVDENELQRDYQIDQVKSFVINEDYEPDQNEDEISDTSTEKLIKVFKPEKSGAILQNEENISQPYLAEPSADKKMLSNNMLTNTMGELLQNYSYVEFAETLSKSWNGQPSKSQQLGSTDAPQQRQSENDGEAQDVICSNSRQKKKFLTVDEYIDFQKKNIINKQHYETEESEYQSLLLRQAKDNVIVDKKVEICQSANEGPIQEVSYQSRPGIPRKLQEAYSLKSAAPVELDEAIEVTYKKPPPSAPIAPDSGAFAQSAGPARGTVFSYNPTSILQILSSEKESQGDVTKINVSDFACHLLEVEQQSESPLVVKQLIMDYLTQRTRNHSNGKLGSRIAKPTQQEIDYYYAQLQELLTRPKRRESVNNLTGFEFAELLKNTLDSRAEMPRESSTCLVSISQLLDADERQKLAQRFGEGKLTTIIEKYDYEQKIRPGVSYSENEQRALKKLFYQRLSTIDSNDDDGQFASVILKNESKSELLLEKIDENLPFSKARLRQWIEEARFELGQGRVKKIHSCLLRDLSFNQILDIFQEIRFNFEEEIRIDDNIFEIYDYLGISPNKSNFQSENGMKIAMTKLIKVQVEGMSVLVDNVFAVQMLMLVNNEKLFMEYCREVVVVRETIEQQVYEKLYEYIKYIREQLISCVNRSKFSLAKSKFTNSQPCITKKRKSRQKITNDAIQEENDIENCEFESINKMQQAAKVTYDSAIAYQKTEEEAEEKQQELEYEQVKIGSDQNEHIDYKLIGGKAQQQAANQEQLIEEPTEENGQQQILNSISFSDENELSNELTISGEDDSEINEVLSEEESSQTPLHNNEEAKRSKELLELEDEEAVSAETLSKVNINCSPINNVRQNPENEEQIEQQIICDPTSSKSAELVKLSNLLKLKEQEGGEKELQIAEKIEASKQNVNIEFESEVNEKRKDIDEKRKNPHLKKKKSNEEAIQSIKEDTTKKEKTEVANERKTSNNNSAKSNNVSVLQDDSYSTSCINVEEVENQAESRLREKEELLKVSNVNPLALGTYTKKCKALFRSKSFEERDRYHDYEPVYLEQLREKDPPRIFPKKEREQQRRYNDIFERVFNDLADGTLNISKYIKNEKQLEAYISNTEPQGEKYPYQPLCEYIEYYDTVQRKHRVENLRPHSTGIKIDSAYLPNENASNSKLEKISRNKYEQCKWEQYMQRVDIFTVVKNLRWQITDDCCITPLRTRLYRTYSKISLKPVIDELKIMGISQLRFNAVKAKVYHDDEQINEASYFKTHSNYNKKSKPTELLELNANSCRESLATEVVEEPSILAGQEATHENLEAIDTFNINSFNEEIRILSDIFAESCVTESAFLTNFQDYFPNKVYELQTYPNSLTYHSGAISMLESGINTLKDQLPQPLVPAAPDLSWDALRREFLYNRYDFEKEKERLERRNEKYIERQENKAEERLQQSTVLRPTYSKFYAEKQRRKETAKTLEFEIPLFYLHQLMVKYSAEQLIGSQQHVFQQSHLCAIVAGGDTSLVQECMLNSTSIAMAVPCVQTLQFTLNMKRLEQSLQHLLTAIKQQCAIRAQKEHIARIAALKESGEERFDEYLALALYDKCVHMSIRLSIAKWDGYSAQNENKGQIIQKMKQERIAAEQQEEEHELQQEMEAQKQQEIEQNRQKMDQLQILINAIVSNSCEAKTSAIIILEIQENLNGEYTSKQYNETLAAMSIDAVEYQERLSRFELSLEVLRRQFYTNQKFSFYTLEEAKNYVQKTQEKLPFTYAFKYLGVNSLIADSNIGLAQYAQGIRDLRDFRNKHLLDTLLMEEKPELNIELVKRKMAEKEYLSAGKSDMKQRTSFMYQEKSSLLSNAIEKENYLIRPSSELQKAIKNADIQKLESLVQQHEEEYYNNPEQLLESEEESSEHNSFILTQTNNIAKANQSIVKDLAKSVKEYVYSEMKQRNINALRVVTTEERELPLGERVKVRKISYQPDSKAESRAIELLENSKKHAKKEVKESQEQRRILQSAFSTRMSKPKNYAEESYDAYLARNEVEISVAGQSK